MPLAELVPRSEGWHRRFATGLGDDEGPAIVTAAALAAASGAKLFTVHARTGGPIEDVPRPEHAAGLWGAVIETEVVLHTCCDDPVETLLDALRRLRPELVVVGTHGRSGVAQLLTPSVAESVARNVSVPTLFVPLQGPGLANTATGAVALRRVLVPAGDTVAVRTGLDAAAWLARLVGAASVEVVLLHVGGAERAPEVHDVPAGVSVVHRMATGSVEDAIVELAAGFEACAIVMPTRWHDGVLDALVGSHTEHVVRRVRCPVLSVPIGA